MKTFIQLKDNIGFAYIDTEKETEGIEVSFGSGNDYICKEYNNGVWTPAELLKYAFVDKDGRIIETRKTYFPSEIGENPIISIDTPHNFVWNGLSWSAPESTPVE
jgi:hypothetical protein